MFGNRFIFAISRSALTVAGVATVLFSSSSLQAQGYPQTAARRYARTQLPGLAAQATRPPAFSDSPVESVAMSPDGWSQSAIRNPYLGYETSPISNPEAGLKTKGATATANRATASSFSNGSVSGFSSAPNRSLNSLPAAPNTNLADATKGQPSFNRQSAADGVVLDEPAHPMYSIITPLTNTDYPRTNTPAHSTAKPPRERYASRSFTSPQRPELTPPQLPEVKFPFTRRTDSNQFAPIPFNNQAQAGLRTTGQPGGSGDVGVADLNSPSLSSPSSSASPSPRTIGGTVDSLLRVDDFANATGNHNAPESTNAVGATTELAAPAAMELNVRQPRSSTSFFVPPATSLGTTYPSTPHSAILGNGPVSHQWGFGYPASGQTFAQPQSATGFNSFPTPHHFSAQPANVGQRSVFPTNRNRTIVDRGEKFDHELKKKEFPPFGEIIATGRFFGSLEAAFLRPHFLGNTAISIDGPAFSESIPFEFDNQTAPHARFGFESKYGPGFELNYFTLNANSNPISETFNGIAPITTIASITGPNRFTQLSADALGETLNANHSFEIETYSFNVFKEIQFKVSRLNGQFGFTYANIAQSLEANVTDGGSNILNSLQSTSDFRGFGPKFGIEYYRPLGHTPFEFVTSFNGTGLFGRRDQFISNTTDRVQRRFGADEFVTVLDFVSGVQYKKTIAENRSWFARVAFVHQSWLGGGTAVDPQGDFGLKGFTFGVGYNR